MNTTALLKDIDYAVKSLKFQYSLCASHEFLTCANDQLTAAFIKQTGVTPSKKLGLTLGNFNFAPVYSLYWDSIDKISRRKLTLSIYTNDFSHSVTIYWKSKTGKDYKLHDANIDCADIEFWFESLNTSEIFKHLSRVDVLPFKLKDLTFELIVSTLNLNSTLSLFVADDYLNEIPSIINGVGEFIELFNLRSEKKDRKDGVVHNHRTAVKDQNNIIIDIDLGSTGIKLLKSFLLYFSKMNRFTKVIIE